MAKPEDACLANERIKNINKISGLEYSLSGTHQYGSVQAKHPGYQV